MFVGGTAQANLVCRQPIGCSPHGCSYGQSGPDRKRYKNIARSKIEILNGNKPKYQKKHYTHYIYVNSKKVQFEKKIIFFDQHISLTNG